MERATIAVVKSCTDRISGIRLDRENWPFLSVLPVHGLVRVTGKVFTSTSCEWSGHSVSTSDKPSLHRVTLLDVLLICPRGLFSPRVCSRAGGR